MSTLSSMPPVISQACTESSLEEFCLFNCNISVTMQDGSTHVTAKPYTKWADAIVCVPACMLHVPMNGNMSLWSAASVYSCVIIICIFGKGCFGYF